MTFKTSSKSLISTGEPFLWGSNDTTTTPSNETKITASDGATGDRFGYTVAVGSGRICVGAYADDDNASTTGSAYIFDLDGTQLAKITASDSALSDRFGWSVAVKCGRIVVGTPYDDDNGSNSGSAYIFDLDGTQLAKIKPSDGAASDYFGFSVAVGSGRIVVGAYGDDNASSGDLAGSAYIFDLDGTQLAKITAADVSDAFDLFGRSVAVGSGRIVVGARGDDNNGTSSGSAYIYDLDGNNEVKISHSDRRDSGGSVSRDAFGSEVAVGSGRIVIGAPLNYGPDRNSGSAYIFNLPEDSNIYWERVLEAYRY